jgi:hypothetical protein
MGGRTLALILVIVVVLGAAIYFAAPSQRTITGQVISAAATTTSCYSYSTNATCSAFSNCVWKNESGWAWCQEKNCWSLYTQSECAGTFIEGKNCSWKPGWTQEYCNEVSCWNFRDNQTSCENNAFGLNCQWDSVCNTETYTSGVSCWGKTQSDCQNSTGCRWGQCNTRGCWSYTDATTCQRQKDWKGANCTWGIES